MARSRSVEEALVGRRAAAGFGRFAALDHAKMRGALAVKLGRAARDPPVAELEPGAPRRRRVPRAEEVAREHPAERRDEPLTRLVAEQDHEDAEPDDEEQE